MDKLFSQIMLVLVWGVLLAVFIVLPIVVTIMNIRYAGRPRARLYTQRRETAAEILALVCGPVFTLLLLTVLMKVEFTADWTRQLVNDQRHPPLNNEAVLTVAFFAGLALVAYLVLRLHGLSQLPPLLAVLCIGGLYLGILMAAAWLVQIADFTDWPGWLLMLWPVNLLLLTVKLLRTKISEWNQGTLSRTDRRGPVWLERLNALLQKSEHWPLYGLLAAVLLLGIGVAVLVLLGQRPDAIVRAWTETSDWNLSLRQGPQNLVVDEHYLCTVAAGGHPRVVKPQRLGVRHGHRVVVNRQLCVANAFEQVLEERTPRFHKRVRGFYDRYGFPLARLIRSQYVADLVYFLMKPLEWLFLIVLYLTDVRPENRIARQYLPQMPNSLLTEAVNNHKMKEQTK